MAKSCHYFNKMERENYPAELFVDCATYEERAARVGRFLILEEMGFFGEKTNLELARNEGKGTWMGKVRKRFSGTYGDVAGCHPADIEVAAEMLGVFDVVFDVRDKKGSRHVGDAA